MLRQEKSSKVIVISGMHRSGTSLVASMIESVGLHIGDQLYPAAASDNPDGYFEDIDFLEFHENVLIKRGFNYLKVPDEPIPLNKKETKFAKRLIAAKLSRSLWGWKDPRTSLFLYFWHDLLPSAKFLFVYRHPLEVLLSLLKRGGLLVNNPVLGLEAWAKYNEKILKFFKSHPDDSTLINVHAVVRDQEKFNNLLLLRLGLEKNVEVDMHFQPESLHYYAIPDFFTALLRTRFPRIIELYDELQASAQLPLIVSAKDETSNEDTLLLLECFLERLEHIYRLLIQENQRYQQLIPMDIIREIEKYPSIIKLLSKGYPFLGKTYRAINNKVGTSSRIRNTDKELIITDGIVYDHPYDTFYAHEDDRFSSVLHIFHLEPGWNGLRSTAGYLPGHKLGITERTLLDRSELDSIFGKCRSDQIRVAVFHGYSGTMKELMKSMRQELGKDLCICVVWQASSAQFSEDGIRRDFLEVLSLKKRGIINRLLGTKHGLHYISKELYPVTMYNIPPSIRDELPSLDERNNARAVMIPLPLHLRKNFYTNLYAAVMLDDIDKIYTTRFEVHNKGDFPCEIIYLGNSRLIVRKTIFDCFLKVDAVMNGSLSECQPLIFCESLAFGTPCLTGPLRYGELDNHPYRKLTEVSRVDSIEDVRDSLQHLLQMRHNSPTELSEMIMDYRNKLYSIAIDNYVEALEL